MTHTPRAHGLWSPQDGALHRSDSALALSPVCVRRDGTGHWSSGMGTDALSNVGTDVGMGSRYEFGHCRAAAMPLAGTLLSGPNASGECLLRGGLTLQQVAKAEGHLVLRRRRADYRVCRYPRHRGPPEDPAPRIQDH